MDPNKLAMQNAVSMESLDSRSLDNASTISSLEPHSQVRTLFVSGLPMDCKPRELYLLFRAYSGYESSLLKTTNKNNKIGAPVGFVTFITRADADDACKKLQGVRFDPDSSQTIRLELARSTTKVSKPKQPSPPIISPATLPPIIPQQNLHAALAAASAPTFIPQAAQQPTDLHNIGDQFHYLSDQSQLFGLSLAQALQCSAASPLLLQNPLATAMAAQIQQQQHLNGLMNAAAVASIPSVQTAPPPNPSGNPPCSTLFVANLGSNVDENEVRHLFKTQPGFSRLRMHSKENASSVCFVEYQNVQCATIVLMTLQGYQLSNQSCIRIEYAKCKMGESNNNNAANATIASRIKTA